MEPVYPCTLSVYRFVGAKAYPHREVTFPDANVVPKVDLLSALAAVRAGLPPNFGASLTDARGYNVR
jgi:hypothetical protein